MTKAVIFDLDGLLIDSEIISLKIYQDILRSYDFVFTKEEYARDFSGKTEIANCTLLIKRYNLPLPLDVIMEIVGILEKAYVDKGIDLKKGAIELINYLKENHIQMAVASSSKRERALTILKKHKIDQYFDAFVFAGEVENGKPNPDIFLKAAEKLGAEPKDCLVLEDSEAGIQAAHSANIPVICIPDMKRPHPYFLNMTSGVLSSLEEVINVIK